MPVNSIAMLNKWRCKITIRLAFEMKASLENLCFEMDRNVENTEIQVRCIGSLFSVLKSEKNQDDVDRALRCVNRAIVSNEENEKIIIHALQLFLNLFQTPKMYPLLENTEIAQQIIMIMGEISEDPQITEMALSVVNIMMKIPLFQKQYNNTEFIKLLISTARVNTKCERIIELITEISVSFDASLPTKKLCSSLVIICRNYEQNRKLQKDLTRALVNLGTPEVMESLASIALPHVAHISSTYPNDMEIFKSLLTLTSRAPGKTCPETIVEIILSHRAALEEDGEMLSFAIQILATKLEAKETPASVVPIAVAALMILITNEKIVRMALTVVYHGISKSQKKLKLDEKLFSTLTSILLLHASNASIVRRASVVFHEIATDTDNLVRSGASYALLQAAHANLEDTQTVFFVISSLASFIETSSVLACQLNRPDHVSMLHEILEKHKSVTNVVRPVLVILRSIVLSSWDVHSYMELSHEKKSVYQIESSTGNIVLSQMSDDLSVVKAALLLMHSSPQSSSYVAAVMKKYTSDEEIQMCGLRHGVKDVDAINTAVTLCGESALHLAIPLLEKAEDCLPTQLIEYLLGCDREDVVDVLILHFGRNSTELIANQFQLKFPAQVILALELYQRKLWQPMNTDIGVLEQAMIQSLFNIKRLQAAMFFLKPLGIPADYYEFLLNAMKLHPRNSEVIRSAASCITQFEPTDEIRKVSEEVNAVAIVAMTLEFNKHDENLVLELLRVLHFLSFFEELDDLFVSSLVIPTVVKYSQVSAEAVNEMCHVLSNLIRLPEVAKSLSESKILDIIFKYFSKESYQLVSELIEQANMQLCSEQFDIVLKQLELKHQLTNIQAYDLLNIIRMSYEMEIKSKRRLKVEPFNSFLSTYCGEFTIVKHVAEILPRVPHYETDANILFGLIEALRMHYTNIDVALPIVSLLSTFEKHKNTLGEAANVELLIMVAQAHPRDPLVAIHVFSMLKGHPQAFDVAVSSLSLHKDREAVLAIASCIFSVSEAVDPVDALPRILSVMKVHRESADICAYLLSVTFFASRNDQSHVALLKNLQLIVTLAVMHINNVNLCRAAIGIICNLSDVVHNVAQMFITPPVVLMIMKVWSSDAQIMNAACICISHFAVCDRGGDFVQGFPALIMALKNRLNIECVCKTITEISPFIEDYAGAVGEELMSLIKKEQNKKIPAACLLSFAHLRGAQDAIFSKITILFEISQTADDDDVASLMLTICAQLADGARMRSFEPFVPNLMKMVSGDKPGVALAAANVCYALVKYRPEAIDKFMDTFALIGQSKRGDLSRVCASIAAYKV